MYKTMTRRVSYFVLIVLLFVLIFTSFCFITYADTATADSDVLTDLGVDETFCDSDYPLDNNDYGLYVIQIAESTDKELLVYVYQPCAAKGIRAKSISMSTEKNGQGDFVNFQNYFLTFCNNRGTLYKYKVKNFEVSDDDVRYYSISSILRPFDGSIDDDPGYDNSISEVPCRVGKVWAFKYVLGELVGECQETNVVEITSKYVGYIHYDNGGIFPWGNFDEGTDSHFVAFDTDYNIDELYKAEIQWSESTWTYEILGSIIRDVPANRVGETFGSAVVQPVSTLNYDVSHVQSSNRIFADSYEFKEIQTVSELLQEENDIQVWFDNAFFKISGNTQFSAEAKEALENQKWVLRFCNTGYNSTTYNNPPVTETIIERTRISDVIILRLNFKSHGQMFDLGVVDNKQTGSLNPAAETVYKFEISDLLKTILWILLALLILFILFQFGPIIFGFLKLIFKIITFPIRAIIAAKKRRKEKKRDKQIDDLIEASSRSKPSYRYRR